MLLGLAEGAMRLRQWLKYGHFSHLDTVYQIDPKTNLRVPVANAKTRSIDINSLGFRGPEIDEPKPPGTLRLAFLGASTTFCAEVSRNELTWPHLVAEQVQAANEGISVDYINGAVPGYTVLSSLRNLRERVFPLDPDVIIIYHSTNDLSVETRAMAVEQGIYNQQADEASWLSKYSLLWYLVEKNLRIAALQQDVLKTQGRLQFSPEELGADFRAGMTELVREAANTADLVVLVTFSHRIRSEQSADEQLEAAASALYYMPFMTPEGLAVAFARYNDIIRDVANESGALLIEKEFDIPGDAIHFNDTVHFKDEGSRAMAQRIFEDLIKAPAFKKLIAEKLYQG
jgi:lysophospholipase L1-like esterase